MQTKNLIADLIETREMCGNEAETLSQWQHENRNLTPQEIATVKYEVEIQWARSQRAAGVTSPLSSEDRAKAHRDIESGK